MSTTDRTDIDAPNDEPVETRLDRIEVEMLETDYDVQDLTCDVMMIDGDVTNAHDRIDSLICVLINILEDPELLGIEDERKRLLSLLSHPARPDIDMEGKPVR
jgi:hypothetical protein